MKIFSRYSLILFLVLILFRLIHWRLFWFLSYHLLFLRDYYIIIISILIVIVGILFSIIFKRLNSGYSFKSLTKPTVSVVLFFLLLVNYEENPDTKPPLKRLVERVYFKNLIYNNLESTEDPKSTKCEGDESCSSKVEERFTSTGKMILSERYSGNGVFIVEFMDQEHNVTGSAKVFTDCNCEITNVNVSTHQ